METKPYPESVFNWTLKDTMDRRSITRYALQQKTGLAMNTIRAMYDGTPTRVDLPALEKVIMAVAELSKMETTLDDVLAWSKS